MCGISIPLYTERVRPTLRQAGEIPSNAIRLTTQRANLVRDSALARLGNALVDLKFVT
jgi:hypothetical protein